MVMRKGVDVMHLEAMIMCPANATYAVGFRYVDENNRVRHDMPAVVIPCLSYAHAKSVVDAYNEGVYKTS
jgi:hypothetical protein